VIVVTVGTNEASFDRLVAAIDDLSPGEEVVVQCGSSSLRPSRATCVDFLPFEELVQLVRNSRVVVTHAGAGSTMVALANGKHPVVVPRLCRYGEAVDDHQVHFAERLAARGLVTIAHPDTLAEVLDGIEDGNSHLAVRADERLVDDLRRLIGQALEAP
jgi:UDP-N-acetylglucosamine transferase subunit ALG13